MEARLLDELQLIPLLNSHNRKTTKYYIKKCYIWDVCQGWLSWLKLAKTCLLISLLHSLKALGHLNEILFSSLLHSLKPTDNLNEIVLSGLLHSLKPLATYMRLDHTRDSMHRCVMFSWSWRTWLMFSSKKTVWSGVLSPTGANYW